MEIQSQQEEKNEYRLYQFRNINTNEEMRPFQKVTFYKLNPDGSFENGTTLEEMLRVCIERLQDLNGRFACRENSIVITKLEESLMWLNKRTEDRNARGVEGKHQA